ncbi:hypothetical protein Pcinc_016957 [Petrolisthes cinctipes]|uniref:Uncharacterized protein n=1 Tax=Petrolisthes cinctipes TaxID=88211 RepID=A0AAE1FV27_PETCI|nr:hypothetical protein Pcinc_016957 [Petrolisthes cinctipes]
MGVTGQPFSLSAASFRVDVIQSACAKRRRRETNDNYHSEHREELLQKNGKYRPASRREPPEKRKTQRPALKRDPQKKKVKYRDQQREEILQNKGTYREEHREDISQRIGSLNPTIGQERKYAQVYFLDPEQQDELRAKDSPKLDEIAIYDIHRSLDGSQWINKLRCIGSYLEEENRPENMRIVIDATKRQSNVHPGRLNLPTVSEVTVLMPESNFYSYRDIIIQTHSNEVHISENHHDYDALSYPLLFYLLATTDCIQNSRTTGWQEFESPCIIPTHLLLTNSINFYVANV